MSTDSNQTKKSTTDSTETTAKNPTVSTNNPTKNGALKNAKPNAAKQPVKQANKADKKPPTAAQPETRTSKQTKSTQQGSNMTRKNQKNTPRNNTAKATAEKNAQAKAPEKSAAPAEKVTSNQSAPPPKKPVNTQINKAPAKAEKPAKKSGGLIAFLALLTGVAGTGLGVYNYDQARKLSDNDGTAALAEQLKAAEAKIDALSKNDNAGALEKQVNALTQSLKASETKANERLSAVEQTQSGLSKTLKGDLNKTLETRLNEVNALLKKVDQIELEQKGISQSLHQVATTKEAVTATGMTKQEVGYLLRMADYKIQSEGDVVGAAGLLKIAEDKLLLSDEGKVTPMVDAIRQKIIQLQGVKPVDTNALVSDLEKLSKQIPNLVVKLSETPKVSEEKTATSEAKGMLGKVGDIIASGVKYTPNDPSKVNVSAETALIEKRLMQVDIRTAELAVRSQNGVMLAESIDNINHSLDKYFADDATAKAIKQTLANVAQQKLETVLPDLGSLADQFDKR